MRLSRGSSGKHGINPEDRLCLVRDQDYNANAANDIYQGPALVEADDDKIVYRITFDLPDAGLGVAAVPAVNPTLPPLSDDNSTSTALPCKIR